MLISRVCNFFSEFSGCSTVKNFWQNPSRAPRIEPAAGAESIQPQIRGIHSSPEHHLR